MNGLGLPGAGWAAGRPRACDSLSPIGPPEPQSGSSSCPSSLPSLILFPLQLSGEGLAPPYKVNTPDMPLLWEPKAAPTSCREARPGGAVDGGVHPLKAQALPSTPIPPPILQVGPLACPSALGDWRPVWPGLVSISPGSPRGPANNSHSTDMVLPVCWALL